MMNNHIKYENNKMDLKDMTQIAIMQRERANKLQKKLDDIKEYCISRKEHCIKEKDKKYVDDFGKEQLLGAYLMASGILEIIESEGVE